MKHTTESSAPARREERLSAVAMATSAVLASAARAEDGYIESDGSQVLNTGYCVGPQTRIVADYSLSDTSLAGGRPSGGYCASAKLYSLRIYNSVGALVHEYLPYSWQGTRTYTVGARCELYGATQTAMSAGAVVEMLPSAFVLVVR